MKTRFLSTLFALVLAIVGVPLSGHGQSIPTTVSGGSGGGGGGGGGTGCVSTGTSVLIGDGLGGCDNVASSGTGDVARVNGPTLIGPALGTPISGVGTNITGVPITTGVSGMAANVAAFLAAPSGANFAAMVTNESGTGVPCMTTSCVMTTPNIGTPSAGVGTSFTGIPLSTAVIGRLGIGNQTETMLSGENYASIDLGSTDDYASCPTAISQLATPAYKTGATYGVTVNTANLTAGGAGWNGCTLGRKAIKKWVNGSKIDPITGDFCALQPLKLYYDGTDMILVSPTCAAASGSITSAGAGVVLQSGSTTTGVDSGIVNTGTAYTFDHPIEACGGTCLFKQDTAIFATTEKTWGFPVNLSATYAGTTGSRTNTMVPAFNSDGLLAATALSSTAASEWNVIFNMDRDGGVLDSDDRPKIYPNIGGTKTITNVKCWTDTGTSTIQLQRDDGSAANILAGNLVCSTSGASTTSFSGSENVIAVNQNIDFVMVTGATSGTPTKVTVAILGTK